MKVYASLVLGIVAVFLLTACGGEPTLTPSPAPKSTLSPIPTPPSQPAETPAARLITVRVAMPVDDNLQWMNFYVAQGAGFFEDEGMDVRIVVPPMPDATGRFMVMGMADMAVLPRPLYLESVGRGEPVLTFANLFQNDPINLVVRKEVAEERGLSADMPLAERLNAMRGLRVGVAPGPPVRLRLLFESVGLDADSDIEMVIIPPTGEGQNPPFGRGEIDALYAHTPFLERALLKQGAVMIVNQSAGEVPKLTNRQIHTLATTQGFASANPQVLVAMARAVYRAQQLIHTDLRATADAIRASEVRLQEPQGLDTIIAIYEPAIPQTPEVSIEDVLRELEFFPTHRTPPDLSGIDLSAHVDNRFALEAVATPTGTTPLPPVVRAPRTGPSPAPAASEPGELTIALPPIGIQALTLLTAIEGGFFEEQGVKVTALTVESGFELLKAVRLGEVPMAVAPLLMAAQSLSSPRPVVAVGAITSRAAPNIVVAGDIARERGLTPDSPLEDRRMGLKGLRLGYAAAGPLGINTALGAVQLAGLDPDQDVELVAVRGTGEDLLEALRDGLVDAFVGAHPQLEETIVEDGAVLLLHLTSGELPSLGSFPQLLLVTVPSYIDQGREELTAVLAGLQEAQQAIRQDPTIAVKALEAAFPEMRGPLLEEGLNIYLPAVPATPRITREGYETGLKALGLEVSDFPFEQVVDNSFIRE